MFVKAVAITTNSPGVYTGKAYKRKVITRSATRVNIIGYRSAMQARKRRGGKQDREKQLRVHKDTTGDGELARPWFTPLRTWAVTLGRPSSAVVGFIYCSSLARHTVRMTRETSAD